VLTNVHLETRGFETSELQPSSLPDVFANRPITVSGKWQGNPEGQLILSGITGNGEKYEQAINIGKAAAKGMHNPALRSLWAREKVRELGDYSKLKNDAETIDETIQQITHLGLMYSILTDYTSFVAVDETPKHIRGSATAVQQATPIPKGMNPQPTSPFVKGGSVPEPSTSALFLVSIITLLMMRSRRCPA